MKIQDDLVLAKFYYSVVIISWIRNAFFCSAFRCRILTINCDAAQVDEFFKPLTFGRRRQVGDAAQHGSVVSQSAVDSYITFRECVRHLFTIEDIHRSNCDGQSADTRSVTRTADKAYEVPLSVEIQALAKR